MATITNTAIAFIKVGLFEHNKQLKCGRLRFGSLNSYSKTEDKTRVDKLETVIHIEELAKENIFTFSHPSTGEINVKVDSANILKSVDQIGHTFCLYAVQPQMIKEESWQLSSKMIEKGDSILIIYNPKEFIRRVENAIFKLGLKVNYDFIKYKSFEGYTGYKSVFEKDITYNDENEFRFFVNFLKDSKEEYLEVGDLSDISTILENKQETGGPRFFLQSNQK